MGARRKLLGMLAALCVIGLLVGAPPALAQDAPAGQGIIEGVVNGPAGPMANMTVTLVHYESMTLLETLTAQSDTQGRFAFEGLRSGQDDVYLASVTSDEVEFSSGMLTYAEGESQLDVTLTVTGTTEDDAGIVIDRTHLIVKVAADGVQVTDMEQISNVGEKAYIGAMGAGGQRTTLRFTLPDGATGISVDASDQSVRFLQVDGGIADTQPVPPGEAVDQIIFSYALPAQEKAWTLDYRSAYPIKALNVLVSAPGWSISSEQLTFAGTMGGEGAFENYAGTDVPADGTVRLTFTPGEGAGMAETSSGAVLPAGQSAQGTLLLVTIGLGIALLAGVLLYPLWRGRLAR